MSYVENSVLYLDVSIQSNENVLEFTVEGSPDPRLPYYEGPYEVEPRKVEQELETVNKSMSENVVVHPIYYAETSNVGGGYTAVIGLE